MSLLLATLAVQPVRLILPEGEGLMTILTGDVVGGMEINAEELAKKSINEVRLLHVPHCHGEICLKKISVTKNVLWCAGCFMRLPVPAEIETVGELVLFIDKIRKENKAR